VRTLLEAGGFRDVAIDPLLGRARRGSLDEAVEFALAVGPAAAALREAGDQARPRAEAAVRAALAPYATPDGVELDYAAWVVHAD
jgi:hypothetical protein